MPIKDWPFSNPANYIVSDPSKIQIADGVARLKSWPSDLMLYAKYNNSFDADHIVGMNKIPVYQGNVLLNTTNKKFGAASLEVPSGNTSNRHVRYSSGTMPVTTVGTISFWVQFVTSVYGYVTLVSGGWPQVFIHKYGSSGSFDVAVRNDAGSLTVWFFFSYSLNVGQWYHIELDFDLTNGETRFFVDGVQKKFSSARGTRSTPISTMSVGQGYNGSAYCRIDDVRIYNTVQHRSNFTPPTSEFMGDISADKPYIQPAAIFAPGNIAAWEGFSEVLSPNNQGQVRYVLSDDSGATWKYWNGIDWVVGGNENNNNSVGEINGNVASFSADPDSFLFRAYLISDGSQQVELDNIALTYAHPDYQIIINPDSSFTEKTVYTVEVNGQDYAGQEVVDYSWWFETISGGEWVNINEDGSTPKGQLQRFLKLNSFILDEIKGVIDAFPVILNVDKTDADYLPLLAALVGIDFHYDIPIPQQREEIKRAVEVYKTKGTIPGIKRFCRNIIGINPEVAEWPKNILVSNDKKKLSAIINPYNTDYAAGLPQDKSQYPLDFSATGDYRFDKFGIYFLLNEFAGIPKAPIKKILQLLYKNIPASTIGRIIFLDYEYQLATNELLTTDIYHAFGTGESSWDSLVPQPEIEQTTLVNEIYRCKPDSIVYLDADGDVSPTPTNQIRVVTILNGAHPQINNQYIREQGLFVNASEAKDSGALLGAINHKGQWKTNDYRVRKTVDLTFQT